MNLGVNNVVALEISNIILKNISQHIIIAIGKNGYKIFAFHESQESLFHTVNGGKCYLFLHRKGSTDFLFKFFVGRNDFLRIVREKCNRSKILCWIDQRVTFVSVLSKQQI